MAPALIVAENPTRSICERGFRRVLRAMCRAVEIKVMNKHRLGLKIGRDSERYLAELGANAESRREYAMRRRISA
ncbi:hypothetical protein [Bradyrhizobium sp.]|uniref:hypothetical protein n=1 Tax=Bradyrhizobium sp. TaxID=376 RepID=UPI0025C24178|nr:hypothetical protein [Bradyrhizobium sp.]